METSGVHVVFGLKTTFITEIINRLVICRLAPLYVPEIALQSSNNRGEVIVQIFDGNSAIEFSLSVEIVHGVERRWNKLRLSINIHQIPPEFEEMVSVIEDSSPFEFSMAAVESILPIDQVGLKVGGANGDILLLGVQVHGIQFDWNRFYTSFVGDEVVGNGKEYGLFVGRHAADTAIYSFAGDVMAATAESDVKNLDLRNIEWAGGEVMLKGTGTYTGCDLFDEIDFWWKAPITLFAEDSALYLRGQFCFDRFRGEEDAIQAALCELRWWDIFFGLLTWVGRLINSAVSGEDEPEITKELIDLSWPQTGRLRPSSPQIMTDGILIQGQGAFETGSSVASVPSEKLFEKSIASPTGCLRPSDPLYGEVLISNEGQASLTICSAHLEGEENYPELQQGWKIRTASSDLLPVIVLPGESTSIDLVYYPGLDAWYDEEYCATLVLHTVKKTVNATIAYANQEVRTDLTAKYLCSPYDGQFIDPDYAISFLPEEVYLEILVDRLARDFLRRKLWYYPVFPEDTIEITDIITSDPAISHLHISSAEEEVVAELECFLPMTHMALQVEPASDYDLLASSKRVGQPLKGATTKEEARVQFKVKKSLLIPAGRLSMNSVITHALLLNRLFLAAERTLFVYDLTSLSAPHLLLKKSLKDKIHSFDISKGTATQNRGLLMACLEGSRLTTLEILDDKNSKLKTRVLGRQVVNRFVRSPFKTFLKDTQCILIGVDGVALFDCQDPRRLRLLNKVKIHDRVFDAVLRRNLVFIATDKGIQVFDIQQPAPRVSLNDFKTESAVTSLRVRGVELFASLEKGGTLVLDCSNIKSIRQIGRYKDHYWRSMVTAEDEIGFSFSDDRKELTLFERQPVMPDITKLKRFASTPS